MKPFTLVGLSVLAPSAAFLHFPSHVPWGSKCLRKSGVTITEYGNINSLYKNGETNSDDGNSNYMIIKEKERQTSLFQDEYVVLAGATGFVGLRTLKTLMINTNVKKIILPVRTHVQSTEAAAERFSSVLAKYGGGLDIDVANPKLYLVPIRYGNESGDKVYLEGLTHVPENLRQICSTVLHLAGCTDWDAPVDELVDTNMKPTLRFLKGAKDVLSNIQTFLFCSTAFVDDLGKIPERSVPEGPISMDAFDESIKYFSNYARVKAHTEAAIHDFVSSKSNNIPRVSIARSGAVSPSIGLDGVQIGWYTNNKSYAALLRLLSPKSMYHHRFEKICCPAKVDTGIVPVDHVANMIVLTGGNVNIPYFGTDTKLNEPFYINMCSPSELEWKHEDIAAVVGKSLAKNLDDYMQEDQDVFRRVALEIGFNKRCLGVLKVNSDIGKLFARVCFAGWTWETNNLRTLHDGLSSDLKAKLPVMYRDKHEMRSNNTKIVNLITGTKSK